MQARDAAGRKVSLLNDDASAAAPQRPSFPAMSRPYEPSRIGSASPNTPELMRSDSYDSNISTSPGSPLTPTAYEFARSQAYASGRPFYDEYDQSAKRPAYAPTSRSNSYDDAASTTSAMPDRPGKRYPCRYRESHGCEKTFTTSGHASRHSKIHTAEKAVQCTFPSCQKKFTRADNMKQHLETHYKDKSRSTTASKSTPRSSVGGLSASARRSSSSGRTSNVRLAHAREQAAWESEHYGFSSAQTPPLPSPVAGAWDMRSLNGPLLSRPSAARTPSSGLDALAMAVACQEGA